MHGKAIPLLKNRYRAKSVWRI